MEKIKLITLVICLYSYSPRIFSTSKDQARKLYASLTGLTADEREVIIISKKIDAGQSMEAARDIIESKSGINTGGAFYNVTVKNFSTPWTNIDYTKMFPLNDLSATVIGYVRDDKPFNQILYKDSIYMASGIKMAGSGVSSSTTSNNPLLWSSSKTNCSGIKPCTFCNDIPMSERKGRILFVDPLVPNGSTKLCRFTKLNLTAFKNGRSNDRYYIPHLDKVLSTNLVKHTNDHYQDIEDMNLDLSDKRLLVHKSQSVRLHQDEKAISGLFTTRAWGKANMSAGTNRRIFQSTMANFFCKDMMDINDTNIPDFRVRRDIDRSPGGNSGTFKSLCVGCHSIMDSQVGAFSYYDFPNGAIVYNQGVVVDKVNHNAIFPEGFITQDDSWMNLANQGQNASFGWGAITGGQGVKSLATMYSNTKEFHRCMTKKVWKSVCYKEAKSPDEKRLITALTQYYTDTGFNLKNLFLKTSLVCMGK